MSEGGKSEVGGVRGWSEGGRSEGGRMRGRGVRVGVRG